MTTDSPANFYHKIFLESTTEFEEIREYCLAEDNWLRSNYTKEFLVLEKLNGYSVIFEKGTDEPAGMGGLYNGGLYPDSVGKHLHREYTFPKFRQRTAEGVVNGWKIFNEHLIKPLNTINPQFDTFFIGMQTRYKKQSKGYWKIFTDTMITAMPEWSLGNGYIRTCPHDVQKCFQNYAYVGNIEVCSEQIITQEQWDNLIQGN
jgi:hypothetical protein